jgi:hypothetical protein
MEATSPFRRSMWSTRWLTSSRRRFGRSRCCTRKPPTPGKPAQRPRSALTCGGGSCTKAKGTRPPIAVAAVPGAGGTTGRRYGRASDLRRDAGRRDGRRRRERRASPAGRDLLGVVDRGAGRHPRPTDVGRAVRRMHRLLHVVPVRPHRTRRGRHALPHTSGAVVPCSPAAARSGAPRLRRARALPDADRQRVLDLRTPS